MIARNLTKMIIGPEEDTLISEASRKRVLGIPIIVETKYGECSKDPVKKTYFPWQEKYKEIMEELRGDSWI